MTLLCEVWVCRDRHGPALDEASLLEGVPEAIRRMQEIWCDHPETIFRFMASAGAPEQQLSKFYR